jgi:hypothetical protein
MINQKISSIFKEIMQLLEIKGDKALSYKIKAYKNAINVLDNLKTDISEIYKGKGVKGIKDLGIGEKNARKIEEYILKNKIKEYEDLKEETAIRQIVTHFFKSKGLGLQELKKSAKIRKIIYSRYTKPAKQLLDLAGSIEKAKEAIDKIASWATSRKLDYTIETVFKKWLELDRLKPKEIIKKPFYKGNPMIFSETKKKWYVISKYGEWLEFADKENTIEWKIIE